MVKCLPEFEYFTVFLKNKHIIFKIRRSKVTDYAALRELVYICNCKILNYNILMTVAKTCEKVLRCLRCL